MSTLPDGVRVQAVGADAGGALRTEVLRPWQPPQEPMYPLERESGTAHFAVLGDDGEPLAVGSVMADPHPHEPREGDWRVRGMATRPEWRGRGLGSLVLDALEEHAGRHGAHRVWCNARIGARSFYERAGYRVEGGEFDLPRIGPHFLMSRDLR